MDLGAEPPCIKLCEVPRPLHCTICCYIIPDNALSYLVMLYRSAAYGSMGRCVVYGQINCADIYCTVLFLKFFAYLKSFTYLRCSAFVGYFSYLRWRKPSYFFQNLFNVIQSKSSGHVSKASQGPQVSKELQGPQVSKEFSTASK